MDGETILIIGMISAFAVLLLVSFVRERMYRKTLKDTMKQLNGERLQQLERLLCQSAGPLCQLESLQSELTLRQSEHTLCMNLIYF
ncbi:MAG: hypothetical protein JEZ07_04925 [Phycisphaerae bacterium]|nr:hypothetical protein [Phycisphaerae bacterium]